MLRDFNRLCLNRRVENGEIVVSPDRELAAELVRSWIRDYNLVVPGLDVDDVNALVVRIGPTTVFTLIPLDDGWHVGTLAGVAAEDNRPIADLADPPETVLRKFYTHLGGEAAAHRRADRRKLAFTIGDFAAESARALRFEDIAHSIEAQGLTSYR